MCLATLGNAIHNAHWGAIHFLGILPNPCLFPKVPGTGDRAMMELKCCSQHLPCSSCMWVQEEALPVRGSGMEGRGRFLVISAASLPMTASSISRVLRHPHSLQSCGSPRALESHRVPGALCLGPALAVCYFCTGLGQNSSPFTQKGAGHQAAWLYQADSMGLLPLWKRLHALSLLPHVTQWLR